MAKIRAKGSEKYLMKLERLNKNTDGICKHAVHEGARVAGDAIDAAIDDITVHSLPSGAKYYYLSEQDKDNGVMLDGKKGVAQKVVYDAFDLIQKKLDRNPLEVFTEALNNIMPALEVKARRVGGATYQVPIEVRPERRQTLGLRWLVGYSRKRSEKTMKERLANEIMDAVNNTGASVKKREDGTYDLVVEKGGLA